MPTLDFKGITIRHLEIFRAIMEAGSARMAAQRLGITQSAVSQQLKHLEELTRTSLFNRSGYRLMATDSAYKLYRLTDQLFYEVNRIGNVVSEAIGQELHIKIAVPHIFGLHLMPQVIKAATEIDKETVYRIGTCNYGEVVERILSGRAQLGIARQPIDPQLLDWRPLCSAYSVCILPPEHPLAARDRIDIHDLAGERLIAIDRQHASAYMDANTRLYSLVEPDIFVYFDAIGYEAAFVAQGNGIAITNSFVASQFRMFNLVCRPFSPSGLYHYVIAWRRGNQITPKLGSFMNLIHAKINPVQQYTHH